MREERRGEGEEGVRGGGTKTAIQANICGKRGGVREGKG